MKTLSKALAILLLAGAASSVQAATGISITGTGGAEYDTAGVYIFGDVNFTGDTDDGGGLDSILFEIWDDSVVKFSDTYSLAVGDSGSFHFDTNWAGLIGTGAPGLGLYITDSSQYALVIDPFFLPHYADPSQCQRDCGPQGVPEPSTWGTMLLGFGVVGLAIRRRREKIVTATS